MHLPERASLKRANNAQCPRSVVARGCYNNCCTATATRLVGHTIHRLTGVVLAAHPRRGFTMKASLLARSAAIALLFLVCCGVTHGELWDVADIANISAHGVSKAILLGVEDGPPGDLALRAWSTYAKEFSGELPPVWVFCRTQAMEARVLQERATTKAFGCSREPVLGQRAQDLFVGSDNVSVRSVW